MICLTKDLRVIAIARNDMILSELDKQYQICAMEREMYEAQDLPDLIPVQLSVMQNKRSYLFFSDN
jgi:hypothetical protein